MYELGGAVVMYRVVGGIVIPWRPVVVAYGRKVLSGKKNWEELGLFDEVLN